jgi:hypothetical protein
MEERLLALVRVVARMLGVELDVALVLGFKVKGLGLGFKVEGLGFRVWGLYKLAGFASLVLACFFGLVLRPALLPPGRLRPSCAALLKKASLNLGRTS